MLFRSRCNRRLPSEHEFEFRDKIDDDPGIWPQCHGQFLAPGVESRRRLTQDLLDQAVKGGNQGAIRDVSLILPELAGRKVRPRGHDRTIQLPHQRGFTNPGRTGNEKQAGVAGRSAVKRGQL